MEYIPDPLQQRISQFIQQNADSYSFSPPGSNVEISISGSEYYETEDRIVTYSKLSKIVALTIGAAVTAFAYWRMIDGPRPWAVLVVGAVGSFVAAIISGSVAMKLALRPLMRRFRDHTRNVLGWKRKGLRGAIRDLRALKSQVAIAALATIVMLPIGVRNYLRRSAILDHGTVVSAEVYRSDSQNSKNTCTVRYTYSWSGRVYDGTIIGCEIMNHHPLGSKIPVRILPKDPGYSIAEGEGFWTADFAAPFIIVGLFAFSALMIVPNALSHTPSGRS